MKWDKLRSAFSGRVIKYPWLVWQWHFKSCKYRKDLYDVGSDVKLNVQNYKSVYHVTLFKAVPVLKMHLSGRAYASAEIADSETDKIITLLNLNLRACSLDILYYYIYFLRTKAKITMGQNLLQKRAWFSWCDMLLEFMTWNAILHIFFLLV